jgi:hypothetical protein
MEKSSFYCENCDYRANKLSHWEEHISTKKHANKNLANFTAECYDCKICDVKCSHLSILNRHKKTKGHIKIASAQISPAKDESIIQNLINDNKELRNFIMEQSRLHIDLINKALENSKPTVINQTNNQNNNNQKFNINVFLNEQCKDAMNFSDFIKGIDVSREDLENNAQLGFVSGISKIILDNLRQLSVNERPIHCTDLKRETMYIKDDDKWTKETGPAKLNSAIQTITQKSTRTLLDWKKENPDYNDNDSEFSNRCIVIQRNSMAGYDRETYYPKVIKAIAKEVTV